jgi:hypothetical protein
MADSTTNLDLISSAQAQKEVTANAFFDAASPSSFGGRRASACSGLTWGYYGGKANISGTITMIANGTLALPASATSYIEFDPVAGAVSSNTTAFTSSRIPLYKAVTGPSTVTSYTDERLFIMTPPSGSGMTNPMTAAGDLIDGGTGGSPARVGIGSTGQVLTVSSGSLPAWATPTLAPMPVNPQTGTSYHPVVADAPATSGYEGIVTMTNASANTVTIDPHGTTPWQTGTMLAIIQLGAGQTAVAAGSGVTINTPSSLTARAQYSTLFLACIGTDLWVLGGDMT